MGSHQTLIGTCHSACRAEIFITWCIQQPTTTGFCCGITVLTGICSINLTRPSSLSPRGLAHQTAMPCFVEDPTGINKLLKLRRGKPKCPWCIERESNLDKLKCPSRQIDLAGHQNQAFWRIVTSIGGSSPSFQNPSVCVVKADPGLHDEAIHSAPSR
jgi:hypothetical protein